MYDSWKVILGIIIFLAIFTLPIWLNVTFSEEKSLKPVLEYPEGEKECVESKDYMTAYHMDLLNEWRDKVVREDQRYFVKNGNFVYHKGQKLEMSLTLACLKCHANKEKFCDQCHNYLDVKPYCWDCHVQPKGGLK